MDIISETLKIEKSSRKNATHFIICNGNQIRYAIDLRCGKNRLANNISTYSKKLELLMKLIRFLPIGILKFAKLGYFANIHLDNIVEEIRQKTNKKYWNAIIGTYDEKQKIVLQCFNKTGSSKFIKVGNVSTDKEMRAEINFLNEGKKYKTFEVPNIVDYSLIEDNKKFNIQVTDEFFGHKVEPILTSDIIEIYNELSSERKVIDGEELVFSHGDFTPWNMKKSDDKYILFDWEHCGYRIKGFDLMHYSMSIENFLNGKNDLSAFESALDQIRIFDENFGIDKNQFLEEYNRLRLKSGS